MDGTWWPGPVTMMTPEIRLPASSLSYSVSDSSGANWSSPAVLAALPGQALHLDAANGHTYEVNVIEAAGDTLIANVIPPTQDSDPADARWVTMHNVAIPATAMGRNVRLEWRFMGDGTAPFEFNGAYLDDVMVTVP
jgi:hypothetical protein